MTSAWQGVRIFVAGHRGLAGSAILRRLQDEEGAKLITRTHAELELTDANAVKAFFAGERPEFVFLCAARVGGILANESEPAEFIYQNLAIQTSVIAAAHRHRVKRLLFLGSSCIYPRECPQPIKESYLLSGPLEPTNQAYAVAKLAGIEMCRAYNRQYGAQYLAVMPTNLYGPNDNYDPRRAHVLPALLRKMHLAKLNGQAEVEVWGTGNVRREFLHSDDMADACVFLMSLPDEQFQRLTGSGAPLVNVGCGHDLTIRELAVMIAEVTGFSGKLVFDSSKPDGTPRKLLDVSRLSSLGWKSTIPLRLGIESVYPEAQARLSQPQTFKA
jgi:GDP-L-fucose synthase